MKRLLTASIICTHMLSVTASVDVLPLLCPANKYSGTTTLSLLSHLVLAFLATATRACCKANNAPLALCLAKHVGVDVEC